MNTQPSPETAAGCAEQAQPSGYPGGLVDPNCARFGGTCGADCRYSGCQRGAPGYTPPVVGAPTWPKAVGTATYAAEMCPRCRERENTEAWGLCRECELAEVNELRAERNRWRAECLDARRRMTELSEAVMDDRADRDRLRAVIAAAYVDLLAGRVDEAIGTLRAAGGQP